MNVLLTGATGLLGCSIVKLWKDRGKLIGVYLGDYKVPDAENIKYRRVDIRNREELEKIFRDYKIDVVIHAAGEARVDVCEKNYDHAYSTNVSGTKNIIELCKKYNAKPIYISTNAVFDGTKPLYKEEDETNPINVYGKIKLECENLVKGAFKYYLIVRPILMYGWGMPDERDNVATWILKKLQNNEKIKLVDNIFDNPLYSVQCADCVLKLVEKNKSGVYHVAGDEVLNRYQLGLIIAETFGYDKSLISPVRNEYFKDIAPRPKDTSYDTGKIRRELGIKPMTFRQGLAAMSKEKDVKQGTTL